MNKLASDFNIVMHATKTALITKYNEIAAVNDCTIVKDCRFNAILTKGKFIVGATLLAANNSTVVEYAGIGDTLLDALYDVLNPATRKFYF